MARVALGIDNSLPNQYSRLFIDNVNYILGIYYSTRMDGWYLTFYDYNLFDPSKDDNSEALLYGGIRLMPNQDCLSLVIDKRLPTGYLIPVDTLDADKPPRIGKDNLGTGKRFELVYFSKGDITDAVE